MPFIRYWIVENKKEFFFYVVVSFWSHTSRDAIVAVPTNRWSGSGKRNQAKPSKIELNFPIESFQLRLVFLCGHEIACQKLCSGGGAGHRAQANKQNPFIWGHSPLLWRKTATEDVKKWGKNVMKSHFAAITQTEEEGNNKIVQISAVVVVALTAFFICACYIHFFSRLGEMERKDR